MTTFCNIVIVGDELIRITLENVSCDFYFVNFSAHFFESFVIIQSSGERIEVDRAARTGNIHAVWNLIGKNVSDLVWHNGVKIVFSDGTTLVNESVPGMTAGAIQSRDHSFYEEY